MPSKRAAASKQLPQYPGRAAFLAGASLLLFSPPSFQAQTAILQHLTPAQTKEVSRKLDHMPLPARVEIEDYRERQMFSMHAPGEEALTIVPVLINNDSNLTTPDFGPDRQCGVYFFKPNGQSRYVRMEWPTISVGENMVRAQLCDGVLGVGATHDPGPRPRLIFLFNESTGIGPHGE